MTTPIHTSKRNQILNALPTSTHIYDAPDGFNADWTTPGHRWRLAFATVHGHDGLAFVGFRGRGLAVKVSIADVTVETALLALQLHGAISGPPDPSATIRQLAQQLSGIDSALESVDITGRGVQGVATLAAAYRDLVQQAADRGQPANQLDDARVLLAEAAKLLALANTSNVQGPNTWHADTDRWLELHEAYFAGAPLPKDPAGLTAPCFGNCGDDSPHDAHLAPGALDRLRGLSFAKEDAYCTECGVERVNGLITHFNACPRKPTFVHEDADPGRPAGMGPTAEPYDPFAIGGLVTAPITVGNQGCVSLPPINPTYQSVEPIDDTKPTEQSTT